MASSAREADLKGKTILITGGSAGIGKEAAQALARRGAQVTLLGRNRAAGEAAAAELRAATGNPSIAVLACDLSDFDSVRRAAEGFARDHASLDVLINNAGLFLRKREVTPAGLEKTFAGLYLGHFLLTNLLLERLKAAPEGRVICVTCPPAQARVRFDDLGLERGYSTLKAQAHAKGALFLFARELTRRLAGTRVTINCMLPGLMIKTNLLGGMPWYFRAAISVFGMTAEEGADTEIWMATTPELKGVSGRYYLRRKERPLKGQTADDEAARKLWDLSCPLVGL
jgi:NAD(P)-dependent dehydrogenase (short-subunit alcohol dehydrogenase family)